MNQLTTALTDILQNPATPGTLIVRGLPLYLVWAAGAVGALARLRRHPMPSTVLLIGLVALILVSASQAVLLVALPHVVDFNRMRVDEVIAFSDGVATAATVVNAVAWILVLAAALGWRDAEPVRSRAGSASPGSAAPGSGDRRAKRPRRAATGRR